MQLPTKLFRLCGSHQVRALCGAHELKHIIATWLKRRVFACVEFSHLGSIPPGLRIGYSSPVLTEDQVAVVIGRMTEIEVSLKDGYDVVGAALHLCVPLDKSTISTNKYRGFGYILGAKLRRTGCSHLGADWYFLSFSYGGVR